MGNPILAFPRGLLVFPSRLKPLGNFISLALGIEFFLHIETVSKQFDRPYLPSFTRTLSAARLRHAGKRNGEENRFIGQPEEFAYK